MCRELTETTTGHALACLYAADRYLRPQGVSASENPISPGAEGTFTLDSWDAEEPFDDKGSQITRVRFRRTYTGDLVGVGTVELVTSSREPGSAGYVGFELFEGTVHGRRGSFVLHHGSTHRNVEHWLSWEFEDSGSGELEDIAGKGQIINDKRTYALDYEFVRPSDDPPARSRPPRRSRLPWRRSRSGNGR